MTDRIGPRMMEAMAYVASKGGASPCMRRVAKAVGPNGSQMYGYRTVTRCLLAGILEIQSSHPKAAKGSKGAVVLTPYGREILESDA